MLLQYFLNRENMYDLMGTLTRAFHISCYIMFRAVCAFVAFIIDYTQWIMLVCGLVSAILHISFRVA